MKKSSLILMAAVVLAAMSCGGSGAAGVLDRAEAIMNERPERALEMLDSLAVSGVRGKSVEARLSLLRSMAMDKNAMDTADVSIVLPAVRYYGRRGDELRKAQAYFYYGRILQNGGDDEAALEAISKAELYAERTDDLYLRGLIADSMGRIYNQNEEFESAIEYYDRARELFDIAAQPMNEMYMYELLSRVYLIIDKTDYSIEHAEKALDMAIESNDTTAILSMTANLAYTYYRKDDFGHASKILNEAADVYCSGSIPSVFNVPLAQIYLSMDEIDSARFYAEAELKSHEDSAPSGVYSLLYSVEAADGNYEQANEYLLGFIQRDFEENILRHNQSAKEADMKYKNKELIEIISQKEIRLRYIVLLSIVSVLALLGVLVAFVQTKKRKLQEKDAEIKEYQNRISTIQEYCEKLESIKKSVPDNDFPIEEQLLVLKELMDLLVHSRKELKVTTYARFKELTIKEESGKSTVLEIFIHFFDITYPGIRILLRKKYPDLTLNDINLYVLIGLGCSTAVIAYIFKTSESYIYNRRMTLRKKLCLSDDRKTFASHLSDLSKSVNGDGGEP